VIAALMEVRGVRHALLVGSTGEVVAQVGLQDGQLSGDVGLVAAGRAVIGSLQSQMNSDSWQEMVLDVDSGPVLLTPHGDQVLLTAFDDVSNLGRVRFAVRKLLGLT
jgi:predicted regulator of Ras-like GTPase activity (Roadblock/LC7/MglB family)